ncbi:MAG: hypothetical protein IJP70_01635 [Bacteroidales bacterium]|nr:hypothetical protein [Bacteroidales bacterium]
MKRKYMTPQVCVLTIENSLPLAASLGNGNTPNVDLNQAGNGSGRVAGAGQSRDWTDYEL